MVAEINTRLRLWNALVFGFGKDKKINKYSLMQALLCGETESLTGLVMVISVVLRPLMKSVFHTCAAI